MLLEQPKDGRYAKNARAVFNLSYHIVWCPKYRRKVLVGYVEQRLTHILYATAQQYGVLIETMEVMPDHVHLFVSSDPTLGYLLCGLVPTMLEPSARFRKQR
jgi:REP element-mobilizing transposase RayT